MSTTDPLIGKKLGDYLVEGLLGEGGMARVYRGYDDKLDRYAAVKVIEPQLIATEEEEEYRERFLREARSIARLNHPRIVGVYQFGQMDNLYYIAMEYVEGRNLRDVLKGYIKQGEYFPVEDMLRILADIADALDYAHKNHIIHRDVKPSNIIVNSAGNAVLTDFGLALDAVEGTIGNTFGSVHYIAPEQAISSAQSNPQSDQYSLAIVAYEMLTGQVPFDDASAMSVALKHISDPPPPLTEINPTVLPEVEQIVMRALDKDHQKRYPSVMSFVNALETAYAMADDNTATASRPYPPARQLTTDTPNSAFVEDDDTNPTNHSRSFIPPEDLAHIRSEKPKSKGRKSLPLFMISVALLVGLMVIAGLALALPSLSLGADSTATADALSTRDSEVTRVALAEASQVTVTDTSLVSVASPTREANTVASVPVSTATQTAIPTDTQASTVTHTLAATLTETRMPTATNTATPSRTATPTQTATFTQTPTPSVLMPDEESAEILLRYDGRTLVVLNRAEDEIADVQFLQFYLYEPVMDEETEETDIEQTNIFRAREWGNFGDGLPGETCVQVWTQNYRILPPQEGVADACESRRFFRSTSRPFWISENPDEAYFEVRRGSVDVLARCPVNVEGTMRELRCLVNLPS